MTTEEDLDTMRMLIKSTSRPWLTSFLKTRAYDTNQKDKDGNTLLDVAIEEKKFSAADVLMQYGAKVENIKLANKNVLLSKELDALDINLIASQIAIGVIPSLGYAESLIASGATSSLKNKDGLTLKELKEELERMVEVAAKVPEEERRKNRDKLMEEQGRAAEAFLLKVVEDKLLNAPEGQYIMCQGNYGNAINETIKQGVLIYTDWDKRIVHMHNTTYNCAETAPIDKIIAVMYRDGPGALGPVQKMNAHDYSFSKRAALDDKFKQKLIDAVRDAVLETSD